MSDAGQSPDILAAIPPDQDHLAQVRIVRHPGAGPGRGRLHVHP